MDEEVLNKRQTRTRIAIGIGIVVVLVGGVVRVGLSGEHGTRVSDAKLERLIHGASSAFQRTPSETYTLTETISGNGQTHKITVTGQASARNHDSTFNMTGLTRRLHVLDVNHVIYNQVPAAEEDLNAGKPWLAVHSLTPTATEQQLQSAGPAEYLELLANVNGKIYDEGTKTVQGVPTTEYSLRVDALKLLGSHTNTIFGSGTAEEFKQLGFGSLPMTIWLDRSGLPRQLRFTIKAHGFTADVVGYFTASNKVLRLKAPPATRVNLVKSYVTYRDLSAQINLRANSSEL